MYSPAIDFYSQNARQFHASYQKDANRQERLRVWHDAFDRYVKAGMFAYDIGCGSGILSCELARRGIETVGIDGAASMIDIAQKTAQEQRLPQLSFQQLHLPTAGANSWRKADLVIASSFIEYLPSLPEGLAFFHALLNEKGIVIFSISNRDSLSRKMVQAIHALTGMPRYLGLIHHFVALPEMTRLLTDAGFITLEYRYFGGADKLNRMLARFLSERISSNMLLLVARKE